MNGCRQAALLLSTTERKWRQERCRAFWRSGSTACPVRTLGRPEYEDPAQGRLFEGQLGGQVRQWPLLAVAELRDDGGLRAPTSAVR